MNSKKIPSLTPRPLILSASLLLAGALLGNPASVTAQVQAFSEDFDTDHTANWTINAGPGVNTADVFFDYGTVGIPSAPHSVGGTTRGLKLIANSDAASQQLTGISASPTGQSFSGDYEVRFDMWCNFNGPAPVGGSGSTQVTGAGIASAGTSANYVGSAIDGYWFAASGDGNSSADYRVYTPSYASSLQDGNPAYLAGGSRNNTASLYTTAFPPRACPAAQVALFPQQTGSANAGSLAWTWHDVALRKVGNILTWNIDGTNLAIIDISTNGTAGGGNILFVQSDINGTASIDPNRNSLLFGLIDNIRVTNLTSTVNVTAPTDTAYEQGRVEGVFTFTRTTTDLSQPVLVNYSLSGTAVNGSDYTNLSGHVTIPTGSATANVYVKPIDDAVAEPTETVVLSLTAGSGYAIGAPASATVSIMDNEPPAIIITNVDSQVYERTNDFARFRLTRWGDINVDLSSGVNITFGGTAVNGVNFYSDSLPISIPAGTVDQTFKVYPIYDGVRTGNRTITATVTSGSGYTVGSPATSPAVTLVDADTAPETVLWSDNLQTDTSANWDRFFAAAPDPTDDATVTWAYDYAANLAAPAAPHSNGDTHGLFLSVNKNDGSAAAAALNLYPKGKSFSGNYAFRFDMFLVENDTSGTTEYALFGINHSGSKTNWFRNSTTTFTGVDATGWNFDGLFFDVESDGADLGQFVGYSAPTTTNHNPTAITPGVTAEAMQAVFKSPPWTVGALGGGTPANLYGSTTPIWADVEIKQVDGIIYWSINHALVFAYTNTTSFTSGNVMLGYEDGYDSIGGSGGGVVYANARVVSLARPVITQIHLVGSNVEITFTANSGDVVGQFALQSTGGLTSGSFTDTSATISGLGGGTFKAVKAASPGSQFYRIKRLE